MATYDFRCDLCGHQEEAFLRVAELDTSQPSHCGQKMRQVILQAPMAYVRPDAHYVCPATGEHVTSYRQRANIFAKHNLRDANDETPEFTRKRDEKKRAEIVKRAKAHDDFIASVLPGVTLQQVIDPTP